MMGLLVFGFGVGVGDWMGFLDGGMNGGERGGEGVFWNRIWGMDF